MFDAERERIFAREWVLVGREESVPASGDYLDVDILGESVLVVRGDDGTLHAFFNVCRHRGCALVLRAPTDLPNDGVPQAGCKGPTIRCPYHSWVYGLDGTLKSAPYLEAALEGRKHEFGLHQAGLETWGGFIFINLDPDGAKARGHTLRTQFGDAMRRLCNYPLADLRIGHRVVYQVSANWKVILENYNECYHCAGVHPELCKIVPAFRKNGGATLDWEHGVPHREGAVTFTLSGQTKRVPLPGLDENERTRHKGELIYPNFMISLSMDHVAAFTIFPRDPGHSTVVCDFLFHPAEIAKHDFDPMDAVEFWDITNRQDWAVVEGVQRGMTSRRFTHGYYAPMESASLDIRRYIAQRLGDIVDIPTAHASKDRPAASERPEKFRHSRASGLPRQATGGMPEEEQRMEQLPDAEANGPKGKPRARRVNPS
jgi:Rieske 2Fe-2S family protein